MPCATRYSRDFVSGIGAVHGRAKPVSIASRAVGGLLTCRTAIWAQSSTRLWKGKHRNHYVRGSLISTCGHSESEGLCAMSLDLVYFSGGPKERVLRAILDAGHRVTHVYVNNPGRWPKVASTIELAKSKGLPITIVAKKADLQAIGEQVADKLVFSAGFAYLFPANFLDRVKDCINVHGSLLPKYPGARTLSWAIEDGETSSGVTVHVVDEGIDTGPIVLQESFPLSPFETTASLARKTGEFEPQVVVRALERFEKLGRAALSAQPARRPLIPPN